MRIQIVIISICATVLSTCGIKPQDKGVAGGGDAVIDIPILAPTTSPDVDIINTKTAKERGKIYYDMYCGSSCHHGPYTKTDLHNKSAEAIMVALNSQPAMAGIKAKMIKDFDETKLSGIVADLEAALYVAPSEIRQAPIADRMLMLARMSAIFYTKENTVISTILSQEIAKQVAFFGGNCLRHDGRCNSGILATNPKSPAVNVTRRGHVIRACRRMLTQPSHKPEITVANLLKNAEVQTSEFEAKQMEKLWGYFLPTHVLQPPVLEAMQKLAVSGKKNELSNDEIWTHLILILCEHPYMEIL